MLPLVTALAAAASALAGGEAELFLAPNGSDAGRCARATPCRSFGRAYEVAPLGAVVEVAAGRYPGEILVGAKAPNRTTAPRVVFRPARGARVEIAGTLEVNVPHIEFVGMKIAKWKVRYDARSPKSYAGGNLTMRNVDTHHFAITSARGVRIVGGDVGPNRNPDNGNWPDDGGYVGAWPEGSHVPADILIDGVTVHDVTKPNAGAHSDCIQFTAGVRVTIRNSRFLRCEHADLMIKGDQGPIESFVIENNVFDRTLNGHWAVNLHGTSTGCREIRIRHNSALDDIRSDSCAGAVIAANIQPSMSRYHCKQANAKLDWNLYEKGTPCGPNDRVGAAKYVDRERIDLRLAAGSAAIDAGNPRSHPARDLAGNRRPGGAGPDIGAFESRGGAGARLSLRSRPRAGHPLSVGVWVAAGAGPIRRAACRATVANSPIPLLSRRVALRSVACTWRIPRRAGGRIVKGTVRLGGVKGVTTLPFSARVARR